MKNLVEAKQKLNGNKVHTLKPNVVLVDGNNMVELTHYGQTIAVWDLNGFRIVKPNYMPGGKLSHTTVKIINENAPPLMRVSSSKSGTFLFCNGEKVQELL